MIKPLLAVLLAAPQIFAPGVISGPANDGSPTFTPDGRTLFFTRSGANAGFILESHLTNGTWSKPTIAPFSGEWNDQHPTMAPDGSYLIFVSTRPAPGISEKVAHLWRVNRTANGWSTPEHPPRTPAQAASDLARIEEWDNGNTNVWSLSLTPLLDSKSGP